MIERSLALVECNRIYFHQFPAQLELMELGRRECSFYIGQTDPSRGWVIEGEYLVRWGDNDYQKCPEKPVYLGHLDVHRDIKDHELRALMRKYGWYKNTQGSPEMIIHPTIKDINIGIIQVKEELRKLDAYYTEFEKSHGFSPLIERKKIKNRQDDLHRIPPRSLIYELCDDVLTGLSKDAKIYVTQDAHAHFCEYLISKGFTNLYTESEYKYFPKNEQAEILGVDVVNLVTKRQLSKMKFDVNLGNPPYQAPKLKGKIGKGGNNSLYIEFIERGVELLKDGGKMSLITPPAALIKSTVLNQPTPTLKMMLENGALTKIDLTTRPKHFSHIGSNVCNWSYVKGEEQGKVEIITEEGTFYDEIEDLYYVGIGVDKPYKRIEHQIYKKIVSNDVGEYLEVRRGKKAYTKDCTLCRFGYPKIQHGLDPENTDPLGFDGQFYEFMTSQLGLWLINYVSRHDVMIYHNLLTGIRVPKDGFKLYKLLLLTAEEDTFINSGKWTNFSTND